MSRELNEMSGIITKTCENRRFVSSMRIAEVLYNAGYRKQEWISVDEALPRAYVSVLGCMTDAGDFPAVRECYRVGKAFFFPALGDIHPISHWMPLPEAPKMKESQN